MSNQTKYTIKDVGCYVDSARGIYAPDAIVNIANGHGADIQHTCRDNSCGFEEDLGLSSCEFSGEYEDEADDFMNTYFPVEGAYWGRNENGDWGLWAIEED